MEWLSTFPVLFALHYIKHLCLLILNDEDAVILFSLFPCTYSVHSAYTRTFTGNAGSFFFHLFIFFSHVHLFTHIYLHIHTYMLSCTIFISACLNASYLLQSVNKVTSGILKVIFFKFQLFPLLFVSSHHIKSHFHLAHAVLVAWRMLKQNMAFRAQK